MTVVDSDMEALPLEDTHWSKALDMIDEATDKQRQTEEHIDVALMPSKHTHRDMHACMRKRTCTHTELQSCVYIYIYVCVCVYVYIYIYMYPSLSLPLYTHTRIDNHRYIHTCIRGS